MKKRKISIIVVIVFFTTITSVSLLVNIFERKIESKSIFFKVVELNDQVTDPAIWGQNFPLQYEDYKKTVDHERTKYGGSEAFPREVTSDDPRESVSQSKIEEDVRLKTMWAGYAFSKDFREERGHAYMLIDQKYTGRHAVAQPGACLNCHASTVSVMKDLGDGDITKGFHALNSMSYTEAVKKVEHPVSCIDCHNPKTMELRITRPAFEKGIAALKKHQGIKKYSVHKDATRQEMRTFVCAQCHVEYYFKGKEKELVYPWSNGTKGDEILDFYIKEAFSDWTHSETKAQVIKAQHPEFELWSQGIHAKSGVSCVDCHMPYKKVGASKITDHHVRSPLLMVNQSCRTCHKLSENELVSRVTNIQDKHIEMRDLALNALVELISQMKNYERKDSKSYKIAQQMQRDAQFLIDFVEAENSSGFHAPQEAARLLTNALDKIRKGQMALTVN